MWWKKPFQISPHFTSLPAKMAALESQNLGARRQSSNGKKIDSLYLYSIRGWQQPRRLPLLLPQPRSILGIELPSRGKWTSCGGRDFSPSKKAIGCQNGSFLKPQPSPSGSVKACHWQFQQAEARVAKYLFNKYKRPKSSL